MSGYVQRSASATIAVTMMAVVACSTPRAQETPSAARTAAPEAVTGAAPSADAPGPASAPPVLHLEVLEERLDVGLSIQNRSTTLQSFSARVVLVPRGHAGHEVALDLGSNQACITLRPGAEQLWPANWGLTLAPDQAPLSSLQGGYRFEVASCEDPKARVASATFTLPADYFVGSSGGK